MRSQLEEHEPEHAIRGAPDRIYFRVGTTKRVLDDSGAENKHRQHIAHLAKRIGAVLAN